MRVRNPVADFFSRLVLVVLIVAAVVAVFVWYLPLIQRNQALRKDIAEQEAKIALLEEDNDSIYRRLAQIEGNPKAVERLLREHLGYGLPGEIIIRFEEKSPGTRGVRSR